MSNLRFTLYLVLIFLVACRQESSLERALAASGDNRKDWFWITSGEIV